MVLETALSGFKTKNWPALWEAPSKWWLESNYKEALRREIRNKKLRKFGHMSKLGVPYLPCSLVWTKISLEKYSSVYPTYLPKKFGHFGTQVCS